MKTAITNEAMFELANKSVMKIPKVKVDELEEILITKPFFSSRLFSDSFCRLFLGFVSACLH